MKPYVVPLLAFFVGFSAVVGYQYIQTKTRIPVAPSPAIVPQPTRALIPPSQALSGILSITKGSVEMITREDSVYKEASNGATIRLGESVATKENATANVSVKGIVEALMGPVAELVFANMFPSNFLLQQKAGKIVYKTQTPISVRALHTLVSLPPGETTINIIDTDISITVKTGSATFAVVDSNNNTNVYTLKSAERANIDDEAREVFLVQGR